jgi:tRNA-dependent cyclodipeptide synthase
LLTYSPLLDRELVYEHRQAGAVEGILRIVPTRASRALATGLDLLPHRPLVLLGFSPGNGYFTRKRVEIATCGFAALLGDVTLVVPDTINAHTYRAQGYSESESLAKARRHGRPLKSHSRAAIDRARKDGIDSEIRLVDWDRDVSPEPSFDEAYARVRALFEANAAFREDVLAKVGEVISGKTGNPNHSPEALREGAEYLLKEFAYMALSRDWFGRDIVVPYYQNFELGHRFFSGEYGEALPGMGWLLYEIEVFDMSNAEEGEANAA